MKIGFIGLGKMGAAMVLRILKAGNEIVVLDLNKDAVTAAIKAGAMASRDRPDLVAKLQSGKAVKPLVVWMMIPSQFVDAELDALLGHVPEGSIIVDGANSDFRLARKRARKCLAANIDYLDVGTGGGIPGPEQGCSMRVGGKAEAVAFVKPVLDALAPPGGWQHFGEIGNDQAINKR